MSPGSSPGQTRAEPGRIPPALMKAVGMEHKGVSTRKDLLENLAEFCRLLRLEQIQVELSSLLSAAEGLKWVNCADLGAFRCMLAATLTHNRQELERFHGLFEQFWLGRLPGHGKGLEDPLGETGEGDSLPQAEEEGGRLPGEPMHQKRLGLLYSPESRQGLALPGIRDFDLGRYHREAMRRFVGALASRPSRRLQLSPWGLRLSLRRTLRRNLQYGGDLMYLELMAPRIRKTRLVLLCDVSGSMEEHTKLLLEFAHILLRVNRSSEVFLFSTEVVRVTTQMRTQDLDGFLLDIPKLLPQWGAGTRIGHCLKSLREKFGLRLLPQKPALAIYSDGWDQGEIELLSKEMEFLKRSCRAIIWLNPLLGTPGYEPTCKGMEAALPFVDLFLPLRSKEDLFRLGREAKRLLA